MSFAKRVIRMRKQSNPSLTDIELSGDGAQIASTVVRLSPDVEVSSIGWPRASSLSGACMRMHVLGTIHQTKTKSWTGVKMRVTFGIGNALHWWIQNSGDVLGNRRRGWWLCYACGRVTGFGGPPNKPCRFCKARSQAQFYMEHSMKLSEDVFVTGHPDMFLEMSSGVFRVVEVKSIDGDMFAKLVDALADHVYQCRTYMWGLQKDERIPVKIDPLVGYVMYVSKKNAGVDIPMKMYPVRQDESAIYRIEQKLLTYKIGIENFPEMLPAPIDECARNDFQNYRARTCPTRGECIDGR